jgi:hypothetical protein
LHKVKDYNDPTVYKNSSNEQNFNSKAQAYGTVIETILVFKTNHSPCTHIGTLQPEGPAAISSQMADRQSSVLHGRSSKEAIQEELHKFAFETKMYAERK